MWKEEEAFYRHAPLVPASYAEDKRRNLGRISGGWGDLSLKLSISRIHVRIITATANFHFFCSAAT
jgi:hypothetical protein